MSRLKEIAGMLCETLKLEHPPIAVSFADAAPAGVPRFEGIAPGGCSFWQEAAKGPLLTSTSDHELCAIGVHTHNLVNPSATHPIDLREVLEVMGDLDYVTDDEVAAIPVLGKQTRHVVYAPLAEAPLPPDVVLLFADSRQGLIVAEAAERVQSGAPLTMGRPACAAIPQAMSTGHATLSLGCCGARTYLDVLTDGTAMWAIPGRRLDAYAEEISVLANANDTLSEFHERRRKAIARGDRPTVRDSLARMN